MGFAGGTLRLDDVVIDTGSAASVFPADLVRPLGIEPLPTSTLRRLLGVGGAEFVFSHPIDSLSVGALKLEDCEIQVGAMEYGFALNGLLGMDFLLAVRALIDLDQMELRPGG